MLTTIYIYAYKQVYYVRLSIANMATSVSRDALLSLGTCLGKLTKTGKFRLHITARMLIFVPPPSLLSPLSSHLILPCPSSSSLPQANLMPLYYIVPIMAEKARYKIWVKENGAQPFLYGSNGMYIYIYIFYTNLSISTPPPLESKIANSSMKIVCKAHVGRWSEDCPEHSGCVILSMADVPLGFGVTARSTAEARRLDPTGIVCFRQADCGEYLRDEDTLFAG